MKVAILAAISDFVPAYSVSTVVLEHIKLLTRNGIDTVFITTDDFIDHDKLPESVGVIMFPRFKMGNKKYLKALELYIDNVSCKLYKALVDCTTCIAHDLIFIDSFIEINCAIKKAAEELTTKFMHVIHSAPSARKDWAHYPMTERYILPEDHLLCYPNTTDIPRLAEMYGTTTDNIMLLSNFVNPETSLQLHPLSTEIYHNHRLWDKDFIAVYPTRLDPAKQIEKTIKLLGAVTNFGYSTMFIVCNSWSNAEKEIKYKEELKKLADEHGLKDILFTSDLEDSKWVVNEKYEIELGAPHKVVLDLLKLSDIFILPSKSEACSLIMLEAGLSKNLMILNSDLESLHEFGGPMVDPSSASGLRSLYYSFGSNLHPIVSYNPSEEAWIKDHAQALIGHSHLNKVTQFFKNVRRHHSPQFVYENQLLPALV